MIIAIASEGKDENATISTQAGRAPFYIILKNKKIIETIKNPFTLGGGGAGFGVAKMLADKKVDLVIASKFGPNMESALKERNIKYKEKTGLIKDIL
jgi:predicted Fe-Mo cluster-binding NifX family protein